VPEGSISQGQIVHADVLGQWLRDYLHLGGHDVGALYMGIDDAYISQHEFSLASGLSDEDVAFQLSVEIQALLPDADVCVDFQLMPPVLGPKDRLLPELQTYQTHVVPRSQVAVLSRMAKAARLDLVQVEGRRDAQLRVQSPGVLSSFSAVSVSLGLQCDAAFGLSLGAWQMGAINFLPHRERAQDVMRRAWYVGMAIWALGGLFCSASLTWVLTAMVQDKQSQLGDATLAARALEEANQAHIRAQALRQDAAEQSRWLLTRQTLHQHTLQWAHVLNQAAQGLWISGVTQQGGQWGVQGEALTSAHAHALMTQLKALDIWVRIPEMRQLQLLGSSANTGLPVWQFRIEAELKGGQ
jgi:hypothetical protein